MILLKVGLSNLRSVRMKLWQHGLWRTSMVTNLVSGVTKTIGFGGEPGDGGDKKPRELHFYRQIWVILGFPYEHIISLVIVLCKFVTKDYVCFLTLRMFLSKYIFIFSNSMKNWCAYFLYYSLLQCGMRN